MDTATCPWAAEHAAHFARLLAGGDAELSGGAELEVCEPDGPTVFCAPLARHWRLDPDSTPDRTCIWIRPVTGGYTPDPRQPGDPPYAFDLFEARRRTSPSPPAGATATRSSSTSKSANAPSCAPSRASSSQNCSVGTAGTTSICPLRNRPASTRSTPTAAETRLAQSARAAVSHLARTVVAEPDRPTDVRAKKEERA